MLQRPAQDDLRGVAAGLVGDALHGHVRQHRVLLHPHAQPLRPQRAVPLSAHTSRVVEGSNHGKFFSQDDLVNVPGLYMFGCDAGC